VISESDIEEYTRGEALTCFQNIMEFTFKLAISAYLFTFARGITLGELKSWFPRFSYNFFS